MGPGGESSNLSRETNKVKMLKLLNPIPKDVIVAFSGGVDSVAVTDFLSRKHNVTCAFFHHATSASDDAFEFVTKFCSDRSLPLVIGHIDLDKPKELSMEEHWRNQRYRFLEDLPLPVITAHHLDDCIETYIFGSLHGQPKVIPNRRNNIVRPFLTTPKQSFLDWCLRKNLTWCDDQSNNNIKYMRNYIRKEIVPKALVVNPGLGKIIKKIIVDNLNKDCYNRHS